MREATRAMGVMNAITASLPLSRRPIAAVTSSAARSLLVALCRLLLATGKSLSILGWFRHGEERIQADVSRWSNKIIKSLGLHLELQSPISMEGQLWVANHLSWLDPLVLLALRPALVVSKAEVADYPIIGPVGKRGGLRFVVREDPTHRAATLAQLAADLRAGRDVLLFPEGTTTCGAYLAPFYEGSLRAAYRLGIPTLPLRLQSPDDHYPWTGDANLLSHLWHLARARFTRLRVEPGPVLHPAAFHDETAWLKAVQAHLEPAPAAEPLVYPFQPLITSSASGQRPPLPGALPGESDSRCEAPAV